ncbi:MAG: MFS transporter [Chloroflexi bacterium]|nr:MFS transporter [Chloroflexota bacterium]
MERNPPSPADISPPLPHGAGKETRTDSRGNPGTPAPDAKRGIKTKWLILSAVMLGSVMGPLDGSIVNTVLPDITSQLQSRISVAQWVPSIYLVTISCLILLYGRLGDIIGHKKVFLTGLVAFISASALCGVSQNIWMLIAFRGIQGLAAGMMMSVAYAIVISAFPPAERGKAMGIYAISIAVGLGMGPTLGGLIAQDLSWRYVFFINIPIGIAAVIWGARIIPRGATKAGQRLDVAGAVTAFVFLTTLLLYVNLGQSWGWTATAPLAILAVAIVFAVAFYQVERTSPQPMLNLELFGSRRFNFGSLSALIYFVALYSIVFLTPFFLFFVLRYDVLKVGLVIAVSPVATLALAPLAGSLSDRFGSRVFTVAGMCTVTAGLLLLGTLTATAGPWDVIWRLVIVGVGGALFQSPNNAAVMGSVPPQRLGIASGMLTAMRNLGMALGVAVSAAILYHFAPGAYSIDPSQFDPQDIAAFLKGLHWAYFTGAALAVLAAVTSLLAVERGGGAKD